MASIFGRTGNTNSSTSPKVSGNKRTKFCSSFGNPDSSTSSNLSAARDFGSSGTGICFGKTQSQAASANTCFAARPFERDAGTGTYLSQDQAAALSNFTQAQDASISDFDAVGRFERNIGTGIFAGSFFGAETGIKVQSQTQPTVSSITPAIVGASSATSIGSTHLVSSITQPTVSSITPAIVGVSSATSSSFGCTHLVVASAPAFGSSSSFGQTPFEQHAQQNMIVTVPQQVSNPFGTLPPMPQMFIGKSGI